MAVKHRHPQDLAETLCKRLRKKGLTCPEIEIIEEIFEVLYFTSLETEEADSLKLHIIYLDPAKPDPDPPSRIVKDRWSYIKLVNPIPFTVSNAAKIALALDPRTSSLAIYPNNRGKLMIWGLIDQVNRFHDFIHYESRVGPDMPGIFQAAAVNIGHIIAYISYEKVAELIIDRLLTRSQDVLRHGPIRNLLDPSIEEYIRTIRNSVGHHAFDGSFHWKSSLEDYWISTLCRILLRTKSFNRGGAYLISPDPSLKGLRPKYRIRYDRIPKALINRGIHLIESTIADDQILDFIDYDAEDIPTDYFLDKLVGESGLLDLESEIHGSIWFISLLSRVDGLVLLRPDLSVRGFGVEIRLTDRLEDVFRSTGPMAASGSLRKVNFDQFGTRHRSMMRYCSHIDNSVGFVISHDGDVRAISNVDGKTVIWEDIRLQLVDFIRRKRRGYEKDIVGPQLGYSLVKCNSGPSLKSCLS